MDKKKIILFQHYLRKHILDFEKALHTFEFVDRSGNLNNTKTYYKKQMFSPSKEFNRTKLGWINICRRIFGILNIRIKFIKEGDLLFTYGCLLITNKPYCVYIENGAALFNYDPVILKNLLARIWFSVLIRLPQCKRLIFMSETAQVSLMATGKFSRGTMAIIEKKAVQIYPFVAGPKTDKPKKYDGKLKILFCGIYYAKGGRELVNAFADIRAKRNNVNLTLVTPLHMLLPEDRKQIESISGIRLIDAALGLEEMDSLYHENDVFMFPTFRDTFGLVLIEAIANGMPVIATDQYATTEMAVPGYNACVFSNHPLLDYDPNTKEMFGKLYDAKSFYKALFNAEKEGRMGDLETFIIHSISKFLDQPSLLEQYSRNSLNLYNNKFHERIIGNKIESVFIDAVQKK